MMPADHRQLMRAHVEALFTHDADGQLVRVNEPRGAPAPRFFLGRTVDGAIWRFRQDVDHELRRELEAAIEDDLRERAFDSPIVSLKYAEILVRSAPVERIELGPAFSFPDVLPTPVNTILVTRENEHLLHPLLQPWLPDVVLSQPLFVSVVDGHAAAVCGSVRQTGVAYEAGVETHPSHRGRGYAMQVVAAWGRAVRDMGRIPLYSTSWQNQASRAVARKLGLIRFGNDMHIT